MIADCYLSVSAPAQHAAAGFLARREPVQAAVLARVAENRAALRRAVGDGSRATLLAAEGGWYAVLRVPRTLTEEQWVLALLDRDDVLVHPGWFFDFDREAFLVISLLPPVAVFARAIARVLARVACDL
jgi:aspartate/methionine/tyrosine aminotransferase